MADSANTATVAPAAVETHRKCKFVISIELVLKEPTAAAAATLHVPAATLSINPTTGALTTAATGGNAAFTTATTTTTAPWNNWAFRFKSLDGTKRQTALITETTSEWSWEKREVVEPSAAAAAAGASGNQGNNPSSTTSSCSNSTNVHTRRVIFQHHTSDIDISDSWLASLDKNPLITFFLVDTSVLTRTAAQIATQLTNSTSSTTPGTTATNTTAATTATINPVVVAAAAANHTSGGGAAMSPTVFEALCASVLGVYELDVSGLFQGQTEICQRWPNGTPLVSFASLVSTSNHSEGRNLLSQVIHEMRLQVSLVTPLDTLLVGDQLKRHNPLTISIQKLQNLPGIVTPLCANSLDATTLTKPQIEDPHEPLRRFCRPLYVFFTFYYPKLLRNNSTSSATASINSQSSSASTSASTTGSSSPSSLSEWQVLPRLMMTTAGVAQQKNVVFPNSSSTSISPITSSSSSSSNASSDVATCSTNGFESTVLCSSFPIKELQQVLQSCVLEMEIHDRDIDADYHFCWDKFRMKWDKYITSDHARRPRSVPSTHGFNAFGLPVTTDLMHQFDEFLKHQARELLFTAGTASPFGVAHFQLDELLLRTTTNALNAKSHHANGHHSNALPASPPHEPWKRLKYQSQVLSMKRRTNPMEDVQVVTTTFQPQQQQPHGSAQIQKAIREPGRFVTSSTSMTIQVTLQFPIVDVAWNPLNSNSKSASSVVTASPSRRGSKQLTPAQLIQGLATTGSTSSDAPAGVGGGGGAMASPGPSAKHGSKHASTVNDAAALLAASTRQFERLVLILPYKDTIVLPKLLATMEKSNLAAINKPNISMRSYQMTDKERQASDAGQLDIITGFQVIDKHFRMIVVEACSGQDALTNLYIAMQRQGLNDPTSYRMFFNDQVSFTHRLYSAFDLDLRRVKLRYPLETLMAMPDLYLRSKVSEECFQALAKLFEMRRMSSLVECQQFDLFPSVLMLLEVESKYGESLSREDMDGIPTSSTSSSSTTSSSHKYLPTTTPEEPVASALASSASAPATAPVNVPALPSLGSSPPRSPLADAAAAAAAAAPTTTDHDQRHEQKLLARRKAATDHSNELYEEMRKSFQPKDFLQERKALSMQKSQEYEDKKQRLTALKATEAPEGPVYIYSSQRLRTQEILQDDLRKQLAQHKNVTFTYSQDFHSLTLSVVNPEEVHRQEVLHNLQQWITPKGFVYPAPRDPQDYIKHPDEPCAQRKEDLHEPFVDNAYHPKPLSRDDQQELATKHADGSSKPAFTTIPSKDLVFGGTNADGSTNVEYFKSVHLCGDGLRQEMDDALDRERRDWEQRLVVDKSQLRFLAHGNICSQPYSGPAAARLTKESQLHKLEDILHHPVLSKPLRIIRNAKLPSGKPIPLVPAPASIHHQEEYVANPDTLFATCLRQSDPHRFVATNQTTGKPQDFTFPMKTKLLIPRVKQTTTYKAIHPMGSQEKHGLLWENAQPPASRET